ncbi:MAG: MoxR family ATPase [Candidatus Altiarchaeota archaeon]|nr:MoxR family ATPase [Candidatus Altiarchaeota archaeon]
MDELTKRIQKYKNKLDEVRAEVRKGVIGQEVVIDSVLKCISCNGHVLLESVPGLAKTLLVRLLTSTVEDATFQRIQFTPDLLPSDITGTTVYEEKRGFYTVKGPIFANFLLGDEINRAPPKVQSAMLQGMQERIVTIGKETFPLPKPFIVLATQNPLEQKGVYPLSLAQVDRFLFKIFVDYPDEEAEILILNENSMVKKMEEYGIQKVLTTKDILEIQGCIKDIRLSLEVKEYITDLVDATRHPLEYDIEAGKYIKWGASPRATIGLSLATQATAMMNNRTFAIPNDVRSIAHLVLRHRLVLNYEGKAKGISSDDVVDEIIDNVPVR